MCILPTHSTSRTPYGLKAEYSYQVHQQMCTGHKMYGQVNHTKSDAEARLQSIQKTMRIYVNPENPQEAVSFCEGIGLYVLVFGNWVFMGR